MEREQYTVMLQREDRHWWYAGMRRAALALFASALRAPSANDGPPLILDAGCGTGGTTVHLRRFGRVVGVDYAADAVRPTRARGLRAVAQASVERLPFPNATFDAATSFEVLYHLAVGSDVAALAEIRRVLKPGGVLLVRLPAHDWLRGEHDRLVHTRHRYTRAEVTEKLRAAGFQPEYVGWANSVLFPAAALKRLLERRDEPDTHAAEPDLWQPTEALNALLEAAVGVEAVALPRRVPLPFGLSVIALGRAA